MKTWLPTSTAGSLPKPSWLAQPETLWSPWKLSSEELLAGKRDAGWNTGLIAVTNFHDLAFGKINAAEVFNKGGDKVLPRLLAVADNIDPGPQLVVEG